LERLLAQLPAPEAPPQPGQRVYRQRACQVLSIFGPVTLRRDYYHRLGSERGFPLDAALGLIDGCTPAAVRMLSRTAAPLPYDPRFQREAIAPIQNKIGQFLLNPVIRNILGQVKTKVSIPFIMDNGRLFIANLSKGQVGHEKSNLLGSLRLGPGLGFLGPTGAPPSPKSADQTHAARPKRPPEKTGPH